MPCKVTVEVLGVLRLHAPAGFEVHVVYDDVRLWDAACIVIVVHACDFMAAEVLERPRASYFAQRR